MGLISCRIATGSQVRRKVVTLLERGSVASPSTSNKKGGRVRNNSLRPVFRTKPDMPITLDTARTDDDFTQILALQRQYSLYGGAATADADTLAREGFVYARHDLRLLRAFAAELPQVVAREGARVVGYTLAMPPSLREALPELVPMFEQFDRMRYQGAPIAAQRYVVGGQVCVDRDYRGLGLMRMLYFGMRDRLPNGYSACVTEVSARNAVSLRAHLAMGFQQVGRYQDAKDSWLVIAWNLC